MISYIIPFHSDIQRLFETIDELRRQREVLGISEVLLCHNGTALPLETENKIKAFINPNYEKLLHSDFKGIGAGYRVGIETARGDELVLSASDLPFGFTDILAFVEFEKKTPAGLPLAIGSKAHPQSQILGHGLIRIAVSQLFYLLRRLLLGSLTPKDSQGTYLGKRTIFNELLNECPSHDYLFSLELATAYTRRYGMAVTELPVTLVNTGGKSSVSVFKDGWKLWLGILQLRRNQNLASRGKLP